MSTAPSNRYDRLLYPALSHPPTHPDRLAVIGRLFGLHPAPVTRCRVLELGCGQGTNLIPMACVLPDSEWVGVDLAARPVRLAQQMIQDLGLANVRIVETDLQDLDDTWGQFDFIIAHGVYSWVAPPVREACLACCRARLAPQGIAFVSYNTYPGHHLRAAIRECLRWHVHPADAVSDQLAQARALLEVLCADPPAADEFQTLLRLAAARARRHSDAHLFHEELAEIDDAIPFLGFVEHARQHGLQYVGESDYFEMEDRGLAPGTRAALQAWLATPLSPDAPRSQGDASLPLSFRLRREQYLDVLKGRGFRQSVLCRAEVTLGAGPTADLIPAFRISAPGRPATPEPDLQTGVSVGFHLARNGWLETDHPFGKAALLELVEAAPSALPFPELARRAEARLRDAGLARVTTATLPAWLSEFLLELYATGLVELHTFEPQHARHPGPRPLASPVARWQIRQGDTVTSLFHAPVRIEDPLTRRLLPALDGTRNRAELREVLAAGSGCDPGGAPAGAVLEEHLERLGRLGLLVR